MNLHLLHHFHKNVICEKKTLSPFIGSIDYKANLFHKKNFNIFPIVNAKSTKKGLFPIDLKFHNFIEIMIYTKTLKGHELKKNSFHRMSLLTIELE